MKIIIILILTFIAGGFVFFGLPRKKNQSKIQNIPTSFYDFNIKTLDGNSLNFKSLQGKRVMIVNTASKCGYTPQYDDLEKIYKTYGGKSFEIIGFPANDFGWQEPGSNAEINDFCKKNYGVTFPMSEKIAVKGDSSHPLYFWLTHQTFNRKKDVEVKWNFNKFLISENGEWVAHLGSKVNPGDQKVVDWIKTGKYEE